MIRILLIAGAFLIFSPKPQAQYNFDENNQRTYKAVLSLQFAEANRLIEIEKKSDPANLLPLCFENYIDFLTLFIGENPKDYDLLKGTKSDRIERLERGDQDSPWYNFCLAEVHLQWAFARIKFGDYTAAAFEIRKAHLLFELNDAKYPGFLVNKIGLGVVHVVVGIIPDSYKWITNLMGVDGTMEGGFNEIRRVAEYSGNDKITLLYKPEALFYLAFLTANLQKNKKEALPVLALLTAQQGDHHPLESPLLVFASASILMKTGHNDDALAQLQVRSSLTQRYPFFYLDFLEGLARLNKLDYSASGFFEKFTAGFRGQNYVRSACQKLAWIALLRGDTARYHQTMKMLQTKGAAIVDEDKQATAEAAGGIVPNTVLLRARLLFDGGYYSLALDELLNNSLKASVKSKRDLIEYNYRLGRIYHETGNYPKALEYYGKVIQRGRSEPYYFAASAACQMGLLYENAGAWVKADSAYHVCLSINTPEYKASLSQKAKAGLNRVKKMIPKT
ncbi:MAG: tetratricopeptide repeat protein [Bacteroidota bacterium]